MYVYIHTLYIYIYYIYIYIHTFIYDSELVIPIIYIYRYVYHSYITILNYFLYNLFRAIIAPSKPSLPRVHLAIPLAALARRVGRRNPPGRSLPVRRPPMRAWWSAAWKSGCHLTAELIELGVEWMDHWVDKKGKILTGNLSDFPMKIMGFSCNCSLKPINWMEKSTGGKKLVKLEANHFMKFGDSKIFLEDTIGDLKIWWGFTLPIHWFILIPIC